MGFEHYLRSGNQKLRCGYTTGTCAALAATGASILMLSGKAPETVGLMTGKGIRVDVPLADFGTGEDDAWSCIIKDAGDDADVTDGIRVYATVSKIDEKEIEIDGGEGVGRVTKPGLDQPVGNAAINSTPRRMIKEAVESVCEDYGYEGGIRVIISVPEGIEAAKRTFNSMIGVEGGISILGTSGIVEPMSMQALVATIEVTMRQAAVESKDLILIPGNYGESFVANEHVETYGIPSVKFSNFLGEALDMAVAEDFERVLLIGHIGKMVKVAGSIMNTHSRSADCRKEIFCAHTIMCGGSGELGREIMKAATTDACIEILDKENMREKVMESIVSSIQKVLNRRVKDELKIGVCTFSNEYGLLGVSEGAKEIIDEWNSEKKADIKLEY